MTIHHLIVSYGYEAVFVLVAVESLGVPLPGETALIAAAGYAGTSHKLSVWVIFAVGAAAAVVGDTIGYWIGDKGGYRLLYRYGRYVRLDEPKIKVARYLFDRHGGAVVFFGRFVSVLRTYAAFLAGTTRMRYRRFLPFNATGGILWAGVYTFLAYYAGSFLARATTPVDVAFGAVGALVVVGGILFIRHHMASLVEKAETAYPGPLAPPGRGGLHRDEPAEAGGAQAAGRRGLGTTGDEPTGGDGSGAGGLRGEPVGGDGSGAGGPGRGVAADRPRRS